MCVCVCVRACLNNACSSHSEWKDGKDVEESDRGLILGHIPVFSWKYWQIPQETRGNTRPPGFISGSSVYEVEMHNITAIIIVRHRTVQIQKQHSLTLFLKTIFRFPSSLSLSFIPNRYPFLFPPWVPDVRSLSPYVISTPNYVLWRVSSVKRLVCLL
jgi:hypothetical protein